MDKLDEASFMERSAALTQPGGNYEPTEIDLATRRAQASFDQGSVVMAHAVEPTPVITGAEA